MRREENAGRTREIQISHMAKSRVRSLRWEVVSGSGDVQSPLAIGFSPARSKEPTMRTSMMLAVFSLAFAACATDDTTYQGDVLPGKTVSKALCPTGCDSDLQNTIDNGAWIPVSATAFVNAHSVVAGTNVCNSLPATGAC